MTVGGQSAPQVSGRPAAALRSIATGLGLVFALWVAVWALHGQFGETAFASVVAAARAQPVPHLSAALGLTVLSFLCLALYDVVGARVVAPLRVPAGAALLAGATGNALSNTLGFHALTGSLVRASIYRRYGLGKAEVARIVSLAWLGLGLGFVTMIAAAELLRSTSGERPLDSLLVGSAIFAGLLVLLAWLAGGRRQLSVFGFEQPLPSARMTILQMCIGTVESAAATGALYVLLPPDLAPPFSVFAVGCIAAVALGVVTHAPGGVGVFEASLTAMLGGAGRADLLAALLIYRAIYNLLPFCVSVLTLALLWLKQRRGNVNSKEGIG